MIFDDTPTPKRAIKCLIACVNANGDVELVAVKMRCTLAAFNDGDHYTAAEEWASDEAYQKPFVVFDERESVPPAVFACFNWAEAPTIEVDEE